MERAIDFKGFNSIFARRLKILMDGDNQRDKITQLELSKHIEVSRQAISQYLDGSVMPNIDKLYKIACYFNVSADYLLGLSDVQGLNEADKEFILDRNSCKCIAESLMNCEKFLKIIQYAAWHVRNKEDLS